MIAATPAVSGGLGALPSGGMEVITGMLPIALGLGADASFRQPMAIAVIGGLMSSTALSLLVVPVVFTYLDALHRRGAALLNAGGGCTPHLP